jgi:nucleoside-diphosphate-sugar epimerase
MDKAIITGASGLIGSAVVRELLRHDIDVLALGRKHWKDVDPKRLTTSNKLKYIQIEMSEILSLSEKVKEIGWDPGCFCVFYNFAWSGVNQLTDGAVEDQIKNVTYSANAVVLAKEIGCTKFVNIGTMEETFAEKYLEFDWYKRDYHSSQGIYAVSKLAARDICKMVAYLQKIDYVHTRFSVPIDVNLRASGYVPAVLKQIANGGDYDTPRNNQLFNLIPLEDLANAYYLIGQKGKNKADYFIGTAESRTLTDYFKIFKNIVEDLEKNNVEYSPSCEQFLETEAFSISDLIRDTAFAPSGTFEDFAIKVVKR